MGRIAGIRARSTWRDMAEGQVLHLGLIVLLVAGATALLHHPAFAPRVLGLTSTGWALVSIWLAVIHQVIVAKVFRLQLHRGVMTRVFGDRDLAVWQAIFLPFLIARPLTLILVGWADPSRLTGLRWLEIPLGLALIAVAIWVLHSVIVHFTIRRAVGGDHFREDIADLPIVREGAFAVTPNAMYGLAFLGLWGIALLFGSWNALVVALFQHVYIWVHWYLTEKPDMKRLYRPVASPAAGV
jgi:hypothetical protein